MILEHRVNGIVLKPLIEEGCQPKADGVVTEIVVNHIYLEQTLSQANTKNTIIFIPAKDGGMQATCGMGTKVTCGNCSKRHCEPSLDGVAIQTPFLKGGCQALPDRGILNSFKQNAGGIK